MINAGRLFYMATLSGGAVGTGLTGVAGERKQSSTRQLKEDVRILGGITDLLTSKVNIRDSSGRRILTNADTLIPFWFGKRANAKPWKYWPVPLALEEGNALDIETLNVGGETGGTYVLVSDPVNGERVSLSEFGYPFTMNVSLGLTGVASEQFLRETVSDRSYTTIFWGAACDINAASLRITDAEGWQWSTDFLPIWAYCGLNTGQVYDSYWQRPYVCRPGGTLSVEVKNSAAAPDSNGNVTFYCSRIPVNQ